MVPWQDLRVEFGAFRCQKVSEGTLMHSQCEGWWSYPVSSAQPKLDTAETLKFLKTAQANVLLFRLHAA